MSFESDTGRRFYRHSPGEVRGLGSRLDIRHDDKAAPRDQKSIFDGQKQFHSRPPRGGKECPDAGITYARVKLMR